MPNNEVLEIFEKPEKPYRPEGWETLKPKYYPLHCLNTDECVRQSYEAGADAMLEALKKDGWLSGINTSD